MRISQVQNITLNSFNKASSLKGAAQNSVSNNTSLERSPMADTVSFGKFGGRYAELTKSNLFRQLISNISIFETLDDSTYLSIEPTEETIINPSAAIYEAKLISYKEFKPCSSDEVVEQIDRSMKRRVEDFNNLYGYESGWEKSLTTTEDFEKAAELAEYLDEHGLFRRAGDSYDNMRDMSKWCYDHLAQ